MASSLACSASYQAALPEQKSAPSPYDQLSGFHLGVGAGWCHLWMEWWAGGKGTCYWSKLNCSPLLLVVEKNVLLLVWRERTAAQRITHRTLNALLMQGYGTRLFVRRDQKMLRFWCPWLQPSSKFVNYTSIVLAIVRASQATQSQLLAVLNRESRLQKATWNCVYWISQPGRR